MVQALLNSIKTMLGSQSTQNKEFKTEAVRNNKNVSSALKDMYKMFSASRQSDSKNTQSLESIEASSASTSSKVDRSNALLQESISLQSQMITELRDMSKAIASLMTNKNNTTLLNQQNNEERSWLQTAALGALGVGAAGAAGLGGATLHDYFMGSTDRRNASLASSVEFSGDVKKVLETIKSLESGGDYSTPNKSGSSSASGAYQFIDGTWKSLAQKYNIGTDYERAMYAPPEIQDAVAGKYVEEILRQNNNDVSKIPLVWYTGNAQGKMSGSALASNKGQAAQTYQSKWLKAYQNIEGDDMGTYPSGVPQPQNNAMGGSGGNVTENQQGIRRLPINSKLKSVLQQAARVAGVDVEVYSGGQPRKGEGGQRTGSTRHDHGNAADVYLYKEGRKLRDPEDREIMAKFVSAAASAGATGIGFGGIVNKQKLYMGESGIHVGFGKPATWGGSPWIASAAAGVFSNKDLQMENTDTSGNYASSYGGNIFGSLMGMGGGPLGAMTGLDNSIASLIAGFFGLPSLAGLNNAGASADTTQTGSMFEETDKEEPNEMMGRSAGPGGISINSPEFGQYKKTVDKNKPKEGDFFNYEYENLSSKIQSSAIVEKANKVAVNSPKPYSQAPMSETRTDYGSVSGGSRGNNDTRASWAPRIAVLRPDDDVTRPLTWAARIKGYV